MTKSNKATRLDLEKADVESLRAEMYILVHEVEDLAARIAQVYRKLVGTTHV